MFIRRCVLLLTLIGATFLLAPGRLVQAGDDWLPIDPTDLKMTSEPKAPGAPAIYLYRQVDRDDKGTASTEYNYLRIKILTEEGRKYANVEIPFDKGGYKVSGIRARTIRPDGTIVNYEGKIFENTIVKSKTLKYLAKTFSMPEASVGSIIEYRFNYDFAEYQIFNSRWILSEDLFTKRAKFSLKPYVGEGWSVQWVSPAGLPGGTEQAKEGPDHIIRMEADNIPAFQTEEYMPPENELKFRVNFIYRDGPMEMNPDKFWVNFGKKQNGRVEDFVNKRKAMEQAVAQIVSPGDPPNKERLNSRELDANIVLVKVDGKDMFFDPGAEFTPFGMLPWMETNVAGLRLDKDGGKWIFTTLPESDASRVEHKGDLKLLEDGSLAGKVTVTWTGLAAMRRRVEERNEDDANRKKLLEDEVKESLALGSEVELTSQPNWKSSEPGLAAEFTLKVPGFASAAGRKVLLPASLFSANEKHLFEHADRIHPVYFEYPYKEIDDLTIDLPLGWKAASLPKPVDQDAKAVDYKLSVEDQKGLLHMRREIRSDLVIVPKDSYPILRNFYQLVRTQDDQQILLQPVSTSVSQ